MYDAPLNFSQTGPLPTDPAVIRQNLVDIIEAEDPGYTASLPPSLVEDLLGTAVVSVTELDQGRVEAINNITPYAANPYLLSQQGLMYGIKKGQSSNASVYVIFSGSSGYIILPGFTVSDGSNQYQVIEGGAIQTSGSTPPLYCVATNPDIFAIPENTVNIISTSIPAGIILTCTNPIAGTPAQAAETVESYKARNMEAISATCQATPPFLRTLIRNILGVNPRLVAIQPATGGWKVIVGSGDPFAIAGAIYSGVLDLSSIIGSNNSARNKTITIVDGDDSYNITFVGIPPAQDTSIDVTWNTTLPGFSGGNEVRQLARTALLSYINSINITNPININNMTKIFLSSIADVLSPEYVTTLSFVVKIGGVITPPNAGTQIIPGDPEGYFFALENSITITQG